MSPEPWRADPVPADTVDSVRSEVPALVEGIVAAVRASSPAYGEVLSAPEGLGIRLGIEQATRAFLDAIEHGRRPAGDTDELWRRLGEAEFQAGRGLEDLRAAFRTGIRAAWRGAAELALRAGVSAEIAIAIAEAIFVYGDELSTDVVEGYLRMQSDEAGERDRRRRRLAQLLLDPAGHDPEALQRAAELARWPVPRSMAVLALDAESPAPVTRRLDLDVLAGADSAGAWVVLPDPDGPGRRASVDRALEGERAALGPTGTAAEAPRSLRWARITLELAGRGALPSSGLLRTSERLSTVILLQDREMAGAHADRTLRALDSLEAAERARLSETLSAWLAHQRRTPEIAAELHVHPQTVRYRIGKLRELLGDALESADGRFELELALRARAALGP